MKLVIGEIGDWCGVIELLQVYLPVLSVHAPLDYQNRHEVLIWFWFDLQGCVVFDLTGEFLAACKQYVREFTKHILHLMEILQVRRFL